MPPPSHDPQPFGQIKGVMSRPAYRSCTEAQPWGNCNEEIKRILEVLRGPADRITHTMASIERQLPFIALFIAFYRQLFPFTVLSLTS